MTLVAKSDHSTGNSKYCSYVLQSNDLIFTFTAPYSRKCYVESESSVEPLPDFDQQQAFEFVCTHGFAARAIGKWLSVCIFQLHVCGTLPQALVNTPAPHIRTIGSQHGVAGLWCSLLIS
eukprot:GHUV01020050.1.p2 GENE.GHUV01020050.1~~GHUV01020050.1.p2  ORF type:complete len:120 (-),score=28.65 GHUV01020050.1:2127-2486(-)